jgi:WhiB family redox-sensing transcriptional regulator
MHRKVIPGVGDPESWMERGACRVDKVPTQVFYPPSGLGTSRPAKAVCKRCAVTEQCAAFASDNGITSGVWGGLTPDERRLMRPSKEGAMKDVTATGAGPQYTGRESLSATAEGHGTALGRAAAPPAADAGTFHAHVRDELERVIADARDDNYRIDDRTLANRCMHTLVLLGVLPETDDPRTELLERQRDEIDHLRAVNAALHAHMCAADQATWRWRTGVGGCDGPV